MEIFFKMKKEAEKKDKTFKSTTTQQRALAKQLIRTCLSEDRLPDEIHAIIKNATEIDLGPVEFTNILREVENEQKTNIGAKDSLGHYSQYTLNQMSIARDLRVIVDKILKNTDDNPSNFRSAVSALSALSTIYEKIFSKAQELGIVMKVEAAGSPIDGKDLRSLTNEQLAKLLAKEEGTSEELVKEVKKIVGGKFDSSDAMCKLHAIRPSPPTRTKKDIDDFDED